MPTAMANKQAVMTIAEMVKGRLPFPVSLPLIEAITLNILTIAYEIVGDLEGRK